jgi:hypothetical protein
MINIIVNEPYYLEVIITKGDGTGESGLEIHYSIYKSSDNSLIETGILPDIGSGIYQKQIILSVVGQYRVFYNPPIKYDESIETLNVIEQIALEKTVQDIDLQINSGGQIIN